MPPQPNDDPDPEGLRGALADLYGVQIRRVMLFGSRAQTTLRRIPTTTSPFLRNFTDPWDELIDFVDVQMDLLSELDAFVDVVTARPAPMRSARVPSP